MSYNDYITYVEQWVKVTRAYMVYEAEMAARLSGMGVEFHTTNEKSPSSFEDWKKREQERLQELERMKKKREEEEERYKPQQEERRGNMSAFLETLPCEMSPKEFREKMKMLGVKHKPVTRGSTIVQLERVGKTGMKYSYL